jgi:hypothetical protein
VSVAALCSEPSTFLATVHSVDAELMLPTSVDRLNINIMHVSSTADPVHEVRTK